MLAIALLVASTIAWIALEAAASPREPHARLPREVATGLALLAVHVAAIADRGEPHWIGLALIVAGIALRVAAIRALGPAFVSATVRPQHLVTAGPYRLMRHPSEVGLVAAAAGAAVLLASAVAAALVAGVLVPLVIARCGAENRVLARC